MLKEMIKAVRQTARERYESSYGWQVVECYTDQEIEQDITEYNLQTVEEAIQHFDSIARLRTERYEEAQSEIF